MRSTRDLYKGCKDEAKERQREDKRGYREWGYGAGVRKK